MSWCTTFFGTRCIYNIFTKQSEYNHFVRLQSHTTETRI